MVKILPHLGQEYGRCNKYFLSERERKRGAFHSTKNSGMKFRVFHVTNGTVFSSWLDQAFPGFAREYEVNKGNKWWQTLCLFYLLWSCSTTPEVKTSGVLGEDDDIMLFSVASSYKRRNWNRVRELFTRAIMPTGRIPLGNGSGRAAIPPSKQVLAFLWSMAN